MNKLNWYHCPLGNNPIMNGCFLLLSEVKTMFLLTHGHSKSLSMPPPWPTFPQLCAAFVALARAQSRPVPSVAGSCPFAVSERSSCYPPIHPHHRNEPVTRNAVAPSVVGHWVSESGVAAAGKRWANTGVQCRWTYDCDRCRCRAIEERVPCGGHDRKRVDRFRDDSGHRHGCTFQNSNNNYELKSKYIFFLEGQKKCQV